MDVKRLEQREFHVLRISILISTPIVVCHILINLDKALQDSFFFHVKRLEQREFIFLWISLLVSMLSILIQILINFCLLDRRLFLLHTKHISR